MSFWSDVGDFFTDVTHTIIPKSIRDISHEILGPNPIVGAASLAAPFISGPLGVALGVGGAFGRGGKIGDNLLPAIIGGATAGSLSTGGKGNFFGKVIPTKGNVFSGIDKSLGGKIFNTPVLGPTPGINPYGKVPRRIGSSDLLTRAIANLTQNPIESVSDYISQIGLDNPNPTQEQLDEQNNVLNFLVSNVGGGFNNSNAINNVQGYLMSQAGQSDAGFTYGDNQEQGYDPNFNYGSFSPQQSQDYLNDFQTVDSGYNQSYQNFIDDYLAQQEQQDAVLNNILSGNNNSQVVSKIPLPNGKTPQQQNLITNFLSKIGITPDENGNILGIPSDILPYIIGAGGIGAIASASPTPREITPTVTNTIPEYSGAEQSIINAGQKNIESFPSSGLQGDVRDQLGKLIRGESTNDYLIKLSRSLTENHLKEVQRAHQQVSKRLAERGISENSSIAAAEHNAVDSDLGSRFDQTLGTFLVNSSENERNRQINALPTAEGISTAPLDNLTKYIAAISGTRAVTNPQVLPSERQELLGNIGSIIGGVNALGGFSNNNQSVIPQQLQQGARQLTPQQRNANSAYSKFTGFSPKITRSIYPQNQVYI